MPQVRASALTNFDQVARFVGLDPVSLYHSANLEPSVASDRDRLLPLSVVTTLLDRAAQQSGCDHFGLLMAESRSFGSIGPVSLLLRHELEAGDIVQGMVRYQDLLGGAIRFVLDAIGDALLVRIDLAGPRVSRQGIELIVACFCRAVADALGRPWHPESVHFTHSAPRDVRAHRRIFNCPVDFDSNFNGIVCTNEELSQPNPQGDSELVGHAQRLLDLIMPASGKSTASERVRRSLRLLLPEQRGTIDQVARNMYLTPRSLQRLLVREGTTFGLLLNEVRRELAQHYLGDSHQVGTVANMTGYRRASSFSRWFCDEFGTSPAEWRQQARHAQTLAPAENPRGA